MKELNDAFKKELEHLINRNSIENECDIPDFLLAEMVCNIIVGVGDIFKKALDWHGCDSICHPAMKFEPEEKCNLCGGYHGNLSCDEYADNPHDLDNNNMKESEPKEECSGDTTCKYCGKCDKEYAERDKPIDQIPSVQDLPVDYDPLTGQHFDKLDKPDPILAVWEKWKNEAYKFDSGLVSVPRNSLREMWQAIKQYAEAQSDNSKHAK